MVTTSISFTFTYQMVREFSDSNSEFHPWAGQRVLEEICKEQAMIEQSEK